MLSIVNYPFFNSFAFMQKSIFIIFSLFIGFANAQQTTKFNYLGTLLLPNNTPISFSIHFNEENGVINGYSLTNIGNPDETKVISVVCISKKISHFNFGRCDTQKIAARTFLSIFLRQLF